MVSPIYELGYTKKICLPFLISICGIFTDIFTTYIASQFGIPEGNINFNPVMELIVVSTALAIGVILYNHTGSEKIYKVIIFLSSIPFIPALINISIMRNLVFTSSLIY